MLLGLLVRNPILPAVPILIWESMNHILPASLKFLSVIFYLEPLLPVEVPPSNELLTFFAIPADPVRPRSPCPACVLVSAAILLAACLRARSTEINYAASDPPAFPARPEEHGNPGPENVTKHGGMDDEVQLVAVSPRHAVLLAGELFALVERAPGRDFVVRTLARREANGLPLMAAELVIAGAETRAGPPRRGRAIPLHFRKTYFPGRLHGDPREEFDRQLLASELCPIPPPIGHEPDVFRSCLIPGQPYARLTPFGGEPPESNIAKAQKLPLAAAAGLWRLAEETAGPAPSLHGGGLAHGTPSCTTASSARRRSRPLLIDFEAAVRREAVDERRLGRAAASWTWRRCCARRSTCSVPSAASRARWASCRGRQLAALFQRPEPFPPRHRDAGPGLSAGARRPASDPAAGASSETARRNTPETWRSPARHPRPFSVPTDVSRRKALGGDSRSRYKSAERPRSG